MKNKQTEPNRTRPNQTEPNRTKPNETKQTLEGKGGQLGQTKGTLLGGDPPLCDPFNGFDMGPEIGCEKDRNPAYKGFEPQAAHKA